MRYFQLEDWICIKCRNSNVFHIHLYYCMNFLKNSVLRADLLGAPTNLRSKGQPFYESVFGGIISIITFLFFVIIFIFKITDAFELKLISYNEAQATSL